MKREDLIPARLVEQELSAIETKLAFFRTTDILNISAACCLELRDYPEPSLIGSGFRGVRAAIVQMLEAQAAEAQRKLSALGVDVQ